MSVDISKRMAVNSIYSIFLESRNPEEISFHHVLQRVNVLIQDRLAYALFIKKEDGTFSMFYPFLNDPIAAKRISLFYQNAFGRSGKSDYKSPRDYLFRILDSDYYLLCIRIIPIDKENKNRFQFVRLTVNECGVYNDEVERGRIKNNVNDFKNGLVKNISLTEADRAVIIRYVLRKVFFDGEADKKNKTGNDSISENFPKYSEYIKKSILFLKERKYKQADFDQEGKEVMHWYQDRCFSKSSIKKLKKIKCQSLELSSFECDFLGEKGALNRAYMKVKSSLHNLLDGNPHNNSDDDDFPQISNFFFFSSRALCEQEQPRNKHYNYGMHLAIPHEQKEELNVYFTYLKSMGRDKFRENNKRFCDVEFNMPDEIKKVWLEWLDEYFWDGLQKKGVHKIIQQLGIDFGRHFRSVIDPAMHNIFVHYPIVFEKGGLDRVISHGRIKDGNRSEFFQSLKNEGFYGDCIRMVALYYLIFGMLPKEHRKTFKKGENVEIYKYTDITLSVVPITVQGVCYGCVAHYASVGDEVKYTNDNWQRNYNMFHNIDIRFRRALRQQMESLFLRKLSEKVRIAVTNIYTPEYLESYSEGYINQYLEECIDCYKGLLPFPNVKLTIKVIPENESPRNFVNVFKHDGLKVGLGVEIKPQNYFIQFFKRDHLDETKVIEAIQSAADSGIAAVEFAERRLSQ
jgi:hypothetical protein